jgi:hypothetical protein
VLNIKTTENVWSLRIGSKMKESISQICMALLKIKKD